ncbi:MAG: transcriptional regulator, partial [Rhodococcus sp. (in: high G+C Gram-positive bacteria)]
MITVSGPSFADAVDRILTATAHSPEYPVLNGLFLELRADALTMTATDRYRLSTRTIAATQHDSDDWSVVVDGDDLRAAMPLVRSRHRIRIDVDRNGVEFGSGDRYCRALPEQFPDYSAVFDAMPPVVTRIVLSRNAVVSALEERQSEYVTCAVSEGRLELSEPGTVGPVVVDAVVRGPAVTMAFAMTTLYPAVVSAIGPDVMIDVSGPTMPVLVRSADGGD